MCRSHHQFVDQWIQVVQILGLPMKPLVEELASGGCLVSINSEVGLTDALTPLFDLVRQFQLRTAGSSDVVEEHRGVK